MIKTFIGLFALIATNSNLFAKVSYKNYLLVGAHKAAMYATQSSQKSQEISKKMQGAIANNKDWFSKHVKDRDSKGQLKYDKRLGISKEEFDYILKNAKSSIKLVKTGEAAYHAQAEKNELKIKVQPPNLTAFTATFKNQKTILVPNFPESEGKEFDSPDSPFGHLIGISWKLQNIQNTNIETLTGSQIKVVVGKNMDDGQCFIDLQQSTYSNGRAVKREEYTLKYQCPK